MFGRFSGMVLCLMLALSTSSCALFGGGSIPDDALKLTVTPASATVQPGEGMLVDVKLENTTKRKYTVRQLNGFSLSCWWWSEKNTSPVVRRPQASTSEDMTLTVELPAQSSVSRRFLLTDVTEETGKFYVQGIYSSPVGSGKRTTMAISPAVSYDVAGERKFVRGEDGLISSADAIRVAKEFLGRPTVKEEAELVENEAGLFDWWVTLTVAPTALAATERAEKGFFVNPYIGWVRKEANPRVKTPKSEEPIPAVSRRPPTESTAPAPAMPANSR